VNIPYFTKHIANRLDRLADLKVLSRNDKLYIASLFKSRWQPLPAYIGMVGCSFVIIWSGFPPLYILAARHTLTSSDDLKDTVALVFDVIGAYIGVRKPLYLLFLTSRELDITANRTAHSSKHKY
jgi:hypothetical protein